MTESKHPVVRLLNTPGVAQVVPRLPAAVLHRLIEQCGLEACVDIVALATPGQLRSLLYIDLWRAPAPGKDERFDAARFGAWLDTLMQSGPEAAAAVLARMDFDLLVGGLSDHVSVFDSAAVGSFTSLEGELMPGRVFAGNQLCEVGGFVVEGRPSSAWDAIVELLALLHDDQGALFAALMRGCVALSDGAREADGFHALQDPRGQHRSDLAVERESRREGQGYVATAQARAFLQAARVTRPAGDRPLLDPVAHASMRDLALDPSPEHPGTDTTASLRAEAVVVPAAEAAVMEILYDAGVVVAPRALLPGGTVEDARLALVREFAGAYLPASDELAFLVNAVLAGCAFDGRSLTPPEASDLVLATCNLGLENWPAAWADRDLVTAFRIGWGLLYRDVCCHAAAELAAALVLIECQDDEAQWSLQMLRRELIRHLGNGEPWRARPAIDAILMLDALSWAVLRALIDECPGTHAALTAPPAARIDPTAITFVARTSEIARARHWLASLPAVLAG